MWKDPGAEPENGKESFGNVNARVSSQQGTCCNATSPLPRRIPFATPEGQSQSYPTPGQATSQVEVVNVVEAMAQGFKDTMKTFVDTFSEQKRCRSEGQGVD